MIAVGRHHRYILSPSVSLMPLADFIDAINTVNGHSWHDNLRLHMEGIF
jgi:hypothetical protein